MSNIYKRSIGSSGAGPIFTINTIPPDGGGNFTIAAGPGIQITPGTNEITIASADSATAYTNVTHAMSPYTVLLTDDYLSVDTSGGVVTLNFPNAPPSLREWIVKDRTGNALANNITITTPGGTDLFDGAATYLIDDNYESIQILANPSAAYELY